MSKIQSQCDHCQTIYDGLDGIKCCKPNQRVGNIDQMLNQLQEQMKEMWLNKKNCSHCYHCLVGNGVKRKCTLNKDQKAKECNAYKFYIQKVEEV